MATLINDPVVNFIHRWTSVWSAGLQGFSETLLTPLKTLSELAALLPQMLQLRANLLFSNYSFNSVRVSVYGARRRSAPLTPEQDYYPGTNTLINLPVFGTYAVPTGSVRPDQFRAALQMRCTFNGDRNTIKYLDGIPDATSGFEPGSFDRSRDPLWYDKWVRYITFLIDNGFQLEGLKRDGIAAPSVILGLVAQASPPNRLGVQFDQAGTFGGDLGQLVHVSNVRAKKGAHPPLLNGNWVIDSVVTSGTTPKTTVYLRGSDGIDPSLYTFGPLSTISLVIKTTFPITNITGVGVGIHKRGAPGRRFRGRRSTPRSVGT